MCTRSGNRCNVDVLSTKMILETISVKVNLFGEISSVWQKFYSLWPFLIVLAKFWNYFGDFSLLWMAKYWTKLPPSYHADVRDFFYTHELDETDHTDVRDFFTHTSLTKPIKDFTWALDWIIIALTLAHFRLFFVFSKSTTFQNILLQQILLCAGQGCGSVGRVVASDYRGPWFESSHQQKFILNVYCQL